MDLKNARTHSIDEAAESPSFEPARQAGLGNVQSQAVLRGVFDRIMDAGSVFIAASTTVSIGKTDMRFHQVSFMQLPQPIKRKLVQLKCSDIALTDEASMPGLKQFVGSLEDQYLYFLEHPEHIFLAHMGRIIAYANQ